MSPRNILGAVLGAALVAQPLGAAPFDTPVILADGRTLNLWCEGKSGPVVVFDSGWAANSRAWRRVMDGLSGTFRVCAQDRAGEGRSSPGPLPRDGEAVAKDLHEALTRGKVHGPWLLVGHSLGALNMRHVARLYPESVAGLVLVDPTIPQGPQAFARFLSRAKTCVEALRADEGAPPVPAPVLQRCRGKSPEVALARWESRASEIESLVTSTAAGLEGQGGLSMPLIVLTAGRSQPTPAATAGWHAQHQQLARISADGEARLVNDSGHMMMIDAPEAIAAAVRDIARKSANTARVAPPHP